MAPIQNVFMRDEVPSNIILRPSDTIVIWYVTSSVFLWNVIDELHESATTGSISVGVSERASTYIGDLFAPHARSLVSPSVGAGSMVTIRP